MERQQETPRDKRPVAEALEKLWGQALVAVESAEDAAQGTLQRVAGLAGWSQDEVRRHAREFGERLAGQREQLQRGVEEGVQRTLTRLKLPRRDDLQSLTARLDKLAARVEALEKQD